MYRARVRNRVHTDFNNNFRNAKSKVLSEHFLNFSYLIFFLSFHVYGFLIQELNHLLNLDENSIKELSIKRGKLKNENESVKLSQNKNEENHDVLGVS